MKIIILAGQEGSGKTTTFNYMLNNVIKKRKRSYTIPKTPKTVDKRDYIAEVEYTKKGHIYKIAIISQGDYVGVESSNPNKYNNSPNIDPKSTVYLINDYLKQQYDYLICTARTYKQDCYSNVLYDIRTYCREFKISIDKVVAITEDPSKRDLTKKIDILNLLSCLP